MGILIEYFNNKIDDNINLEEFCDVGNKIGFKKSQELFELRNIPIEVSNEKFDEAVKWRNQITEQLGLINID